MKPKTKDTLAFVFFLAIVNVFVAVVVGGGLWLLYVNVEVVEETITATGVLVTFFIFIAIANYYILFRTPEKRPVRGEFKSVAFFQVYKSADFAELTREIKLSPRFRKGPYLFFSCAFIATGLVGFFLEKNIYRWLMPPFFTFLTIHLWVNRARLLKVATAFFIGSSLISMGKLDEALAVAGGALRIRPRNMGGHWLRGNVLMAMGDFPGAIEAYEIAISFNPRSKALLLPFIGLSHHNMGAWSRAKKSYTDALRLNPGSMESHYGMASVLAREGNVDMALSHLDRALTLGYGDLEHIENDDDLGPLRGHAKFTELLDKHFADEKLIDASFDDGE